MEFSRAGDVFDLYVDWDRRLAREIPFLEQQLRGLPAPPERPGGALAIADVACGTGRHAIALARDGLDVTGIDPDPDLLEKARAAAEQAGARARWLQASFETLPALNLNGRFCAVFCLGNSISLAAPAALGPAVSCMAGLLRAGGVLILHTINYAALARRPEEPWGPVRVLEDGTLLLKGFVPRVDGPWDTLFVALRRRADGGWDRTPYRFRLYPHARPDVAAAAARSGCAPAECRGGFAGEDPDDPRSADLVYVFRKGAD